MNGIETKLGTNIEDLIKNATEVGWAFVPIITPSNNEEVIRLEISPEKDSTRVLIDTHSSSWDIRESGQTEFLKACRESGERGEYSAGKRVLRIDTTANKVGYWLHKMLEILKDSNNIEEIEPFK